MDTGWANSETMFMGVITATGSVKPLNHPRTPLFLMLLYQMIKETINAHTMVQLKSAVAERKKPVMPMREPQMEERKMVMIKGVQWALWGPMVLTTMSCIMVIPFSTMICRGPGRVLRSFPRMTQRLHRKIVTIKKDTVVCVMGIPPRMGIVK